MFSDSGLFLGKGLIQGQRERRLQSGQKYAILRPSIGKEDLGTRLRLRDKKEPQGREKVISFNINIKGKFLL